MAFIQIKRKNDTPDPPPSGTGKLAARFRKINILLFAIAFFIMASVMTMAFSGVIANLSADYAESYAESTSEALSAHATKEIRLMSKAAHSAAVIDWLNNEYDVAKRELAFEEMAGIVGELYSFNLYVVVESSRNEYRVGDDNAAEYIAVLYEHRPIDSWYFECMESDRDYILSIDIDTYIQRKRVWIDYRVQQDGVPLGVICTGLEFSHVAGELFSHYESNNMRGLIIDSEGMIHMDSDLMDDRDFLHEKFEVPYEEVFSSSAVISAINSYLDGVDSYFTESDAPDIAKISYGPHRFITIAPIKYTNWSVMILSGPSAILDISYFIPVSITVLILLVAFALATSAADYQLIFMPLGRLDQSILMLKENHDELLYGAGRDDELGHLSSTIQDLFHKANFDALTGIYNRRFMESNLVHIVDLLSRSNDLLSVIMMDIDHFKKYNDTYGHEEGDACLKAVAEALSGTISRASDFAARYGGEEFIAVLPNTDEHGARLLAEKLLNNVRALQLPHENNSAAPYVTISIGITTGKISQKRHWEEYVKRADEALYMSKRDGRDQYTYLEFVG